MLLAIVTSVKTYLQLQNRMNFLTCVEIREDRISVFSASRQNNLKLDPEYSENGSKQPQMANNAYDIQMDTFI